MKNILFDVDGTIFDTFEGVGTSVVYALKKLGESVPEESTLRKFIGPPLVDGFMQFTGLSREKADKAVELYREYYNPTGVYMAQMYDGIGELLKELSENGKRLYVVSSKPTVFVEKLLKKYGIDKYFADIAQVSFANCEISKKELIESLIERHSLDKSDTVMVGDRKFDIEGAKQAGVKSIGVTFGFGSREELTEYEADYIADSAVEIKAIVI